MWEYEKWSCGDAKCWAKITQAPSNGVVASINLPGFLVNEKPAVFPALGYCGNDGVAICQPQTHGESGSYKTHIYMRRIGGSNAVANDAGLNLFVIGKWK